MAALDSRQARHVHCWPCRSWGLGGESMPSRLGKLCERQMERGALEAIAPARRPKENHLKSICMSMEDECDLYIMI